MKFGEVIEDLLKNFGLDPKDSKYSEVLSTQLDIPENVAKGIRGFAIEASKDLMTFDAAKNNVSIRNHFIHGAYDPLDKEIHSFADMIQFSDEEKQKLSQEKSTGKKQKVLFELMQDKLKEAQKSATQAKKDKDPEAELRFKQEVEDLRKALAQKDIEKDTLVKQKDDHFKNYILDSETANEFNKHPWSENYNQEDRPLLAKNAIDQRLSEIGAIRALDENNKIVLKQSKNPELDYFDNSNKKITFTELVPKIMADKKYLRVSGKTDTITNPTVATGSQPRPITPSKSINRLTQVLRDSQKDQGL